MTHDKPYPPSYPDDATEFARQDAERDVLNEIVTEEQRQRHEIEKVIAEMLDSDSMIARHYGDELAAILKR